MKKTYFLVFALMIAMVPFAAFSQTVGVPANDTVLDPAPIFDAGVEFSLTENASFGVFRNELGAASSADETGFGPRFSELESNYLFGGLGNLGLATAVVPGPFFVGYYSAGDMPWSAFVRSDLANVASVPDTVVVLPLATKAVGASTYQWIDNKTTTEYDNVMVGSADNSAQFLISIGGMNTGLYLRNLVDNTAYAAADNFVETDEFYYDTQAINAVAPSPALDYRVVTEEMDMGGAETAWEFAAPLFLRTGDMSHYARVGLSLATTDFSTADSLTFTVPEDSATIPGYGFAANEFTNESNSAVFKNKTVDLGAKYTLTLPGMVTSGDNDELAISANVGTTFYGREESLSAYIEDFAFVVGGDATSVAGTKDETDIAFTYESVTDFDVDLMATHSAYFDLGPALLGLVPGLGVGFERDHVTTTYLTEAVVTSKTDDALTGTTTFTQTVVDSPAKTDTINVSVMIPASLDVAPGTLPFGFILGAVPSLNYAREATDTNGISFTQRTVDRDAAGTVTGDTTTVRAPTEAGTTVDHNWSAFVRHNIGLYMNVGERVRIDVAMNGSNLLVFENFTLQTVIALP